MLLLLVAAQVCCSSTIFDHEPVQRCVGQPEHHRADGMCCSRDEQIMPEAVGREQLSLFPDYSTVRIVLSEHAPAGLG